MCHGLARKGRELDEIPLFSGNRLDWIAGAGEACD
jgi:hypothetical protein